MIDLPIIAALTAAGIAWKATDVAQKYFELDLARKQREANGPHDPLQKHLVTYKSTASPFIDTHFVPLDGIIRPKYSSIYDLMDYIRFTVPKGVVVDKLVTHYVVDCRFRSKLEDDYDMGWVQPIINLQFERKYLISNFTEDEKNGEHFNSRLEMQAMIDLWNFYYNKYPKILQHPAIFGKNKKEHVILR